MNKEEFYHIGRGSLNLNGKFYYGLDYEITDFMKNIEEKNINYKQALNETKEKLLCYGETFDSDMHQQFQRDCLQIIDKVLDNEK